MADDFRAMKAHDKQRRERNLKAADPAGWTIRTEYHWQRDLLGDVVDYWPSRNKWRWRGKTHHGSIKRWLEKRQEENNPQGDK
jgi:hypothetical protein